MTIANMDENAPEDFLEARLTLRDGITLDQEEAHGVLDRVAAGDTVSDEEVLRALVILGEPLTS